jgi:DNA-binding MarR family transcriptional regulator
MDKMMVSDLIKTLEKKRLIQRRDNPEDGRSFLIEPTRLGRKTTNSAVRKVEALDTEFFTRVKDVRIFHADLIALVDGGAPD